MRVLVRAGSVLRGFVGRIRYGRDRPSFRSKVEEERRKADRAAEIHGCHRRDLWSWDSKEGGRELARTHGVHAPATLQPLRQPSEIEWEGLPNAFVIKPDRGAGGTGVYVLGREGNGFRSLLDDRLVTPTMVVSELATLVEEGRIGPMVYAETAALIHGRPSFDWKMYAFQGRVELIRQVDRIRGRHKFYDSRWEECTVRELIDKDSTVDRRLPLPYAPKALTAAGEVLSSAVRVPFVRVDLFESDQGVVFGEFTPRPGRQRFAVWMDEHLGRCWEESEVELLLADDYYDVATGKAR